MDEARVLVTYWGDAEVCVWVEDEQTIYMDLEASGDVALPAMDGNNHIPWDSGMVAVRVTTEDGEYFLTLSPGEAREIAWTLRQAADEAALLTPTVRYEV